MSPAALAAPLAVLVSAVVSPIAAVSLARSTLERGPAGGRDWGARWGASIATVSLAGLHALGGVRLVGPSLVDHLGDVRALVFGALVGVACAATGWRAMRSLPPFQSLERHGVGAAAAAAAVVLLFIGVSVVWSRSDVETDETARYPLDDAGRAGLLHRVERRSWMNPWDPDVYLARAWNSHHDDHHERALADLEAARRLGGDPVASTALEADVLAALDRCDEARVVYERWQRYRATRAMTEHFGDELEGLVLDDEDPFQPTEYLLDCDTSDYFGE